MSGSASPSIGIVSAYRPPTLPAGTGAKPQYDVDLRIDGWLVQPSLNLVSHGDTSVHVRAQLMDLLLCLASRPGKVVSKEELVATVWDGRWIAPSGLSRCVAELRAALRDDAQQPRIIQTITKRGYRLIAAVVPQSSGDAPRPVLAGRITGDAAARLAAEAAAAHVAAAEVPDRTDGSAAADRPCPDVAPARDLEPCPDRANGARHEGRTLWERLHAWRARPRNA